MAIPISFKPQPVDPHQELMRRVDAAPREHAEALLVAWDLLQTAHDQGIRELLLECLAAATWRRWRSRKTAFACCAT